MSREWPNARVSELDMALPSRRKASSVDLIPLEVTEYWRSDSHSLFTCFGGGRSGS